VTHKEERGETTNARETRQTKNATVNRGQALNDPKESQKQKILLLNISNERWGRCIRGGGRGLGRSGGGKGGCGLSRA